MTIDGRIAGIAVLSDLIAVEDVGAVVDLSLLVQLDHGAVQFLADGAPGDVLILQGRSALGQRGWQIGLAFSGKQLAGN